MNNITLGQILTGTEARDAIHIAIAPVVAKEKLYPCQASSRRQKVFLRDRSGFENLPQ